MDQKLTNNYTIHVDDATKGMIEKIAQQYQRKPSELLRILLMVQLKNEWLKIQKATFVENNNELELAKFHL